MGKQDVTILSPVKSPVNANTGNGKIYFNFGLEKAIQEQDSEETPTSDNIFSAIKIGENVRRNSINVVTPNESILFDKKETIEENSNEDNSGEDKTSIKLKQDLNVSVLSLEGVEKMDTLKEINQTQNRFCRSTQNVLCSMRTLAPCETQKKFKSMKDIGTNDSLPAEFIISGSKKLNLKENCKNQLELPKIESTK